VLRRCFPDQVRYGFVGDLNGEGDEANAYNSETQFLVSFSTLNIRINRHSPKQCCTGYDLDQTIYSETDKRNAPCNYSSRDSDSPFEAIPYDGETADCKPWISKRAAWSERSDVAENETANRVWGTCSPGSEDPMRGFTQLAWKICCRSSVVRGAAPSESSYVLARARDVPATCLTANGRRMMRRCWGGRLTACSAIYW